MPWLENWGVVDLPIVLILCVFLASLAIGLGVRGLGQAEALREEQKSIQSFDRLVEVSTEVSYGEVGEERRVKLELGGGKIIVHGRLIQLLRENEVFRSEYLPLPLLEGGKDNFSIRSGNFSIELMDLNESERRLVLVLRRC